MMKKFLQKRIVAIVVMCGLSLFLLVSLDTKEERAFAELRNIPRYGIKQLMIYHYNSEGDLIIKEITDPVQMENISKAFESVESRGGEQDFHFYIRPEDGAYRIAAFVTDRETYMMWQFALLMEFGEINIYYGKDDYVLHLGNTSELLQAVKNTYAAAE